MREITLQEIWYVKHCYIGDDCDGHWSHIMVILYSSGVVVATSYDEYDRFRDFEDLYADE